MNQTAVDLAFALAGIGFAAGWAIPTVTRMRTAGSRAGVSALTLAFTVVANGGWLAVAAHQRSAGLAVASLAYLSGGVAGLVVHRRLGGRTPWVAGIVGAALLAVAFVRGGPDVGAAVLLAAVVARLGPQVVAARTSRDTTGISAVAWAVTGLEGFVWLAYGTAVGAWPMVGWGAFALVCAVAILTAVATPRRHRPPAALERVG